MKEIPLSILEFGYIDPPNLFAHHVINSLFEEISIYDAIGYKRFWLSEHYSKEFAWHNPEILLPLLAGYSNDIILGVAGILLSYHSPLRVALNFKMLSSIYADRIDLGLARASVPEHISCYLTPGNSNTPAETWTTKVDQLFAFLNNHNPETSLIEQIIIPPQGTTPPTTWFLGSSVFSVENAIMYRSNFCLSFMHPSSNYDKNKDVIKKFKEHYFKTYGELPNTSVLIASSFDNGEQELRRFNTTYNGASVVNPCGNVDFIIEKMNKINQDVENDEFVLFSPVANRERKKDFFQTILPEWQKA